MTRRDPYRTRVPHAIRAALVLSAGLAAVAGQALGQDSASREDAGQHVLAVRSVQHLVGGGIRSVPGPPPFSAVGERLNRFMTFDALELDAPNAVETDGLVEALRGWLARRLEEDAFDAVSLSGDAGAVMFSGPPVALREVDRLLEFCAAEVVPEIRVTASLFAIEDPGERDALRGIVDMDPVRGRGRVLWQQQQTTRAGHPVALGNLTRRSFLRDFEVDVAQDAGITTPRMGELLDGAELVVEPHLLGGTDDLVVFVQGLLAQVEPELGERVLGHPDLGVVQVPRAGVAFVVTGARLPTQKALAIWSLGSAAGVQELVLTLECERLPPRGELDGAVVLPLSGVTAVGLQKALSFDPDPEAHERHSSRSVSVSPSGSWDRDDVDQLVFEGLSRWHDGPGIDSFELGSATLLLAPPAACARATEVLRRFEDAFHRPVELRARTLADDPRPGNAQRELLHLVVMPGLAGRVHVFRRGVESTAIQGYGHKIAAKAALPVPEVQDTFSGMLVNWQPWLVSGELGAAVRLDLIATEVSHLRRAGPGGADLWPAQVTSSRFHHSGQLPVGQALELGDGPRQQRPDGTTVVLRPAIQVQASAD